MKTEMSSLDVHCMIKELQDLIGGRIDKIYQKDREFLLTMHVTSKGKKLLKVLPNTIYLTEYKEIFSDVPNGFCQFLRKYLGGLSIKSIKQKEFERIIEITFEGKEKTFIMIIELFSKGNLILCDENLKVMSALESHKWKDRTIRGGIEYQSPPSKINLLELKEKYFIETINNTKRASAVSSLAVDIGLGGLYAEELFSLSSLDKEKKSFTNKELKTLFENLKKLLLKKINANIVGDEILPFELKTIGKGINFDSFSEAIDEKLTKKALETHESSAMNKKETELEKIRKIINQQEQTINGMKISADENQKKGEFIYEHYEQIKKILEDFNLARKKLSWKEIKEKLKGHKIVKQIKDKEGKITIEI